MSSSQLFPSVSQLKRRKPISWQYIAGFFDGEGNITLKLTNSKVAEGNGTYMAFWRVAQKEIAVLKRIQRFLDRYGIKSTIYTRKGGLHGELNVWQRGDVLFILAQTIPYLTVKRQHCLDVYDYLLKVERLVDEFGPHYWRLVERPERPRNSRERSLI